MPYYADFFFNYSSQSRQVFKMNYSNSFVRVGGSVPVLFTYNSEFHSKENRGFSITFMSSFWAIGGIIACGKNIFTYNV